MPAQVGFIAMEKPPSLPLIVPDVLPGECRAPGTYSVHGQAEVFDTWRKLRHRITVVQVGGSVTLLSGLSEVSKPDVITVTSPVPELRLSGGARLLRYTYRGEGWADFWGDGRWFSNVDGAFVRNADGSGCQTGCRAREVEAGRKVWWFRVRMADGRVGWTNAGDSLRPK